ncbi:hypothetical protein T45_09159 [Streptomyces turgidiscabies]|nr:hypothetical protein T45_09159 [Streptomyces turgidiscabies]
MYQLRFICLRQSGVLARELDRAVESVLGEGATRRRQGSHPPISPAGRAGQQDALSISGHLIDGRPSDGGLAEPPAQKVKDPSAADVDACDAQVRWQPIIAAGTDSAYFRSGSIPVAGLWCMVCGRPLTPRWRPLGPCRFPPWRRGPPRLPAPHGRPRGCPRASASRGYGATASQVAGIQPEVGHGLGGGDDVDRVGAGVGSERQGQLRFTRGTRANDDAIPTGPGSGR